MREPTLRTVLGIIMTALTAGCGSLPGPPGPGESSGAIPDLRGSTVMVLPVQIQVNVPQEVRPDLELAYALGARGEGVSLVFPSELEEILDRSPGVQAQIRDLPVRVFLQAEVNRVGDPLFRNLVRLSGLTGAEVALIPVELRYNEGKGYQLGVALILSRTGHVTWYGVVEGGQGDATDPAAMASLADAMASLLLPFG